MLRRINNNVFIMICGVALFVFILFEVSASQINLASRGGAHPGSRYGVKIYLDDGAMSLLSGYLGGSKRGLTFKNVIFETDKLSNSENFLDLPCYPFSQKVISVTDGKSAVLVYEAASDISRIKRYYLREMKRRGWNRSSEERFHSGVFLFQNGESICLLHLERNSGVTNITIVVPELARPKKRKARPDKSGNYSRGMNNPG